VNPLQLKLLWLLFLHAFAITFLVRWARSRGKPNFLRITFWSTLVGAGLAVVVAVGLGALFFYMMSGQEIDHAKTPLTVQQARQQGCPIPLPDSARNVQFVYASGGLQALEILVRFEAPVDVCQKQVQTVFDAWAKQTQRSLHPLPLVPLVYPPEPEDHDMVGRASWFDVEKIERGLKAGDGSDASYDTQFWVDEGRGLFYCKITD
jgi:hypothetical protein